MHTASYVERSNTFDLLFEEYVGCRFGVRLWDGWSWRSPGSEKIQFELAFNCPAALEALFVRPSEITLGEAFVAGEIDVTGDFPSAFNVAEYVFHRPEGRRRKLLETASRLFLGMRQRLSQGSLHSIARDRAAISRHYDQPASFYRAWLGKSLVYSCAYFECADDDLDAAQEQKLGLICRKLRLHPDDRFLDIGCGWGSLVLYAATHHDVYAHGITISEEQAAVARSRICDRKLTQSCKVDLLDYRDVPARFAQFNKIASVGMFEHVGLKNLRRYFQTARDILRPGGVFLNHGIAQAASCAQGNGSLFDRHLDPLMMRIPWLRRAHASSFVDKYVFPDGELATISEATRIAEDVGLEVRDIENLREHYELTLCNWVKRLQENAAEVRKLVSEETYRIWLLYMAGSAAAFSRGEISVYQTLFSRPDRGCSRLPLTRRDWYAPALRAGM